MRWRKVLLWDVAVRHTRGFIRQTILSPVWRSVWNIVELECFEMIGFAREETSVCSSVWSVWFLEKHTACFCPEAVQVQILKGWLKAFFGQSPQKWTHQSHQLRSRILQHVTCSGSVTTWILAKVQNLATLEDLNAYFVIQVTDSQNIKWPRDSRACH